MARTKKPKVQIKREKMSLGWAYNIYIDGMYVYEDRANEGFGPRWRKANARSL